MLLIKEEDPSAIPVNTNVILLQRVKQCALHDISSEQSRVHLKTNGKWTSCGGLPPSKEDEEFLEKYKVYHLAYNYNS